MRCFRTYDVATSCRPARISEADDDAIGRRKKLTTDFTDDTDEEDEAQIRGRRKSSPLGLCLICDIREICVIRGSAASVWLRPIGCVRCTPCGHRRCDVSDRQACTGRLRSDSPRHFHDEKSGDCGNRFQNSPALQIVALVEILRDLDIRSRPRPEFVQSAPNLHGSPPWWPAESGRSLDRNCRGSCRTSLTSQVSDIRSESRKIAKTACFQVLGP